METGDHYSAVAEFLATYGEPHLEAGKVVLERGPLRLEILENSGDVFFTCSGLLPVRLGDSAGVTLARAKAAEFIGH